jgi:uncharacterized protein
MTSRKTALITGASSGIGAELARQLAVAGYDLVLTARRTDRLEALAAECRSHGAQASVLPLDLAAANAVESLYAATEGQGQRIDVLVNNAGFGDAGDFGQEDAQTIHDMLEVNIVALTLLTRRYLTPMLERRTGRILNVASVAGYQPCGPGMLVYFATKNYVLSFSRGLATELKGTGVSVTALCPGPTRTEFDVVARAGKTRLFKSTPLMEAAPVARAGIAGMEAGRVSVVPGLLNKIIAVAGELPPRSIATWVNNLLLRG